MTKNRMRVFEFVPVLFLAAGTLVAQEPFRLQEATIEQIQAALKSKRVTCRELIGHYLKRIEALIKPGRNSMPCRQSIKRRSTKPNG